MNILFFFYKSKANLKGTPPIFCRITMETKRRQFSTDIYIKETAWNSLAQKAKGNSQDKILKIKECCFL
jgi:integrase/recombinase XerD